MSERYRVFKYIDCEKYGVSDDIADYTLATFSNHFEAERLCELLNKQDAEIKNLKKALWESEKSYIEETNQFSIDIERDMEFLNEEFEREYWND